MGELRPWHIIIVVALFFILFGYKKLPDATRALGRSLRILKSEVKTLHDEESETPAADAEPKPATPRAVEAPKADATEPAPPASPVAAGAPTTPTPDDHR